MYTIKHFNFDRIFARIFVWFWDLLKIEFCFLYSSSNWPGANAAVYKEASVF